MHWHLKELLNNQIYSVMNLFNTDCYKLNPDDSDENYINEKKIVIVDYLQ